MRNKILALCITAAFLPSLVNAAVTDQVIEKQRSELAANSQGKGFGPQSPRDIDTLQGENQRIFSPAPASTEMNLCNIHIHKNAEHKGGEFTLYAGNGDGHGYQSGYKYSGKLTPQELSPLQHKAKTSKHDSLSPGDTIEAHYVYSTAQVKPGATLGACLSEANNNPQLRVETQVYVLVNDSKAMNFVELTKLGMVNGLHQAVNIPSNTGTPIQYVGSTTGPSYNEVSSPFQVSWSVRPQVMKVDISSVEVWLQDNAFDEDHAHGVRNLVINPALLSNNK